MNLNKNTVILFLIFLFPVFIATVEHGGSTLFALLLITGLVLGWPMWRSLENWEKKILIGFLIFFVLISFSLINTQYISSGIKKEGRYIMFPLIIPIYLLLKKYKLETGKIFLLGLMVAPIVMLSQSLYQGFILNFPRARGAYSAIILGDVAMLVALIVACALLTMAKKWQHFLIGLLVIGMALSVSIMSGSIGGWILIPITFIWFTWIERSKLGVKSILSIVFVGVFLVLSAYSIDKVKNRVLSTISEYKAQINGSSNMSSMSQRFEMWRISIFIWKTQPLLGTGIGDFSIEISQKIIDGKSFLTKDYSHAHNIYFDAIATSGLVGLLGLLIFVQIIPYKIFYSFWKKEHDPWLNFYALSGMATIIAFAVFGLTEGWLARKPFVLTYIMCILVFMSSISVVKSKEKEVISHKS